jgi:hypothetical protein
MEMYDTYQRRISECDQQLQKHLAGFVDHPRNPMQPSAQSKAKGRKPSQQQRMPLRLISAVNLSASLVWT